MKTKVQLISGACVCKQKRNGDLWFIVKSETEDGWEIPKSAVRKGESSVRTSIRIMAELGGMRAKVLEEAGRMGGTTVLNGKTVPQRHLYYLMIQKGGGEVIGYQQFKWLDYSQALKKLSSKKDKRMLKSAHDVLKNLQRDRGRTLGGVG